MIRIFAAQPADPPRLDRLALVVVVNLALAIGAALLAFVYSAIGFAAGDGRGPIPAGITAFLWMVAGAVAALGFGAGLLWLFPWLAAVLTAVLLIGVFSLVGDFGGGLIMGVTASAVFLLGALIGRATRLVKKSLQKQPA